jgi:hypothetical protein
VAAIPRDTPAALAAQIRRLAADVFGHSYVAAMRPTLAISVALLGTGAALCLLLPGLRANAATAATAARVTPAPDAVPAPVIE